MTTDIITRDAMVNDIGALLDLYDFLSSDNERISPELAEKNMQLISQINGSAVLIAETDGKVLSTCTVIIAPNLSRGGRPYAIIENVVTHPDYRGKGLGTAVLDAASDRAWGHGCYKVMLSTGSSDSSVRSFYVSAGFEQSRTGFQKRHLPKLTKVLR